ncbi:Astacin-like metalloprotease toxin 1 [Araneus ventricosus]|uniref:Metalloendopeptidase n=1 Tax=Araneus ventricosus TaxID=182803 RepID=A0A4Y2T3E9_ARAVE|nr:Astacin-like metalloprotease toxin 1 [Araneus ventricosus]
MFWSILLWIVTYVFRHIFGGAYPVPALGPPSIPYEITPVGPQSWEERTSLKSLIKRAMDQYHKLTCLKFVERKKQEAYVKIVKEDGCWSYVGKQGKNQTLSLGKGCEYVGTIVHELGHAIGLYHEQQRTDRNDSITVYMNNVLKGYESNFDMIPISHELRYTTYDCNSIMQYGEYAFSKKDGVLKTMEGKKADCKLQEPYDKPGLTNRDIDTVKRMYKCK